MSNFIAYSNLGVSSTCYGALGPVQTQAPPVQLYGISQQVNQQAQEDARYDLVELSPAVTALAGTYATLPVTGYNNMGLPAYEAWLGAATVAAQDTTEAIGLLSETSTDHPDLAAAA